MDVLRRETGAGPGFTPDPATRSLLLCACGASVRRAGATPAHHSDAGRRGYSITAWRRDVAGAPREARRPWRGGLEHDHWEIASSEADGVGAKHVRPLHAAVIVGGIELDVIALAARGLREAHGKAG